MPMPPKTPINKNGCNTYFSLICLEAQKFLNVNLNVDGYDELMEKYLTSTPNDKNGNWELAKELNAWSEYFSEMLNYIQQEFLDAETDKVQIISTKSIEHSDKVAAGERFANTSEEVITIRKKRNALKALYDTLEDKREVLDKAFYQCKNSLTPFDKTENKN